MAGPLVREYDRKLYKKCIKCRTWKPREDITDDDGNITAKRQFGKHESSSDGRQSICYACKNISNAKARERNPSQRIRHHTGTRCLTQLGEQAPPSFVANLEDYLGYRINTLVKALSRDLKEREGKSRKLRDALNEGYHIDHIQPLSSFEVVYRDKHQIKQVDWDIFRECWAISNLRAIPADENLAKGATIDANTADEQTQEAEEKTGPESEADAGASEEEQEEVAASSDSP